MQKSKLRLTVEQRAGCCCEYCRYPQRISGGVLHLEHIIPRTVGGPTDLDNLALACQRCNGHKSQKINGEDVITGKIVRLFNPRRDDWATHFHLSQQTGEMEGLTPVGRVTVQALGMNEPDAVSMRKVLLDAGIF